MRVTGSGDTAGESTELRAYMNGGGGWPGERGRKTGGKRVCDQGGRQGGMRQKKPGNRRINQNITET